MHKINFQITFDKDIDNKKQFDTVEKFWTFFFTKNLTNTLLQQVDFVEHWNKTQIEYKSRYVTQEWFDSQKYKYFKETAKNTTKEIQETIIFELLKEENHVQTFNITFNINYNIEQNCHYCSSIDNYFNKFIISTLQEQTEEFLIASRKLSNDRGIRLHEEFNKQLNEMKNSLLIEDLNNKKILNLK